MAGHKLDEIDRKIMQLQIERGTPVRQDTEAVLRAQGLTGIAYVELEPTTTSGGLSIVLPFRDGEDDEHLRH